MAGQIVSMREQGNLITPRVAKVRCLKTHDGFVEGAVYVVELTERMANLVVLGYFQVL